MFALNLWKEDHHKPKSSVQHEVGYVSIFQKVSVDYSSLSFLTFLHDVSHYRRYHSCG